MLVDIVALKRFRSAGTGQKLKAWRLITVITQIIAGTHMRWPVLYALNALKNQDL